MMSCKQLRGAALLSTSASTTCEQLDAMTKQKKILRTFADNFEQFARSARQDSILDL
jgi:hypothetical protein